MATILSTLRRWFAPRPAPMALPAPDTWARLDSVARPSGGDGMGWHNLLTGQGDASTDKARSTRYGSARHVERQEAWAIYCGDDLAARVVDLPVGEALRQGWEIEGLEPEQEEALRNAAEALPCGQGRAQRGLMWALRQWLTWGEVEGGSGLVLVYDDGALGEPVPEPRPRLVALRVVSAGHLTVHATDDDPDSTEFGAPLVWRWSRPGGQTALVHRDRLITYGRSEIPEDVQPDGTDGWGLSVYSGCYDTLGAISTGRSSATTLVANFEMMVLKLAGFAEMTAANGEGLLNRLGWDKLIQSVHRLIVLDTQGEEVDRVTSNVTGLAELLRLDYERLAAERGMPITLLMGQAPAGLSTDDESGRRFWYDRVKATIQQDVLRAVREVYEAILAAPDSPAPNAMVGIEMRPLYQETERERADRRQVEAQTDAIYLDRLVLTPDEVAAARFGGEHSEIPLNGDRPSLPGEME